MRIGWNFPSNCGFNSRSLTMDVDYFFQAYFSQLLKLRSNCEDPCSI